MTAAERLVILDRDGVINRDSDDYVKSLSEWIPYPAAIGAIARLNRAGWTVAVATNQSGISRGYYGEEVLEAMHERLRQLVREAGGEIAHIAFCPHGPDDDCDCRKPLPGMLEEIRRVLVLNSLKGSWMVGDSLRDLQAGEPMGCRPVLVRTGKGHRTEEKGEGLEGVMVFDDLAGFVDWLLARKGNKEPDLPSESSGR
ncbi:D-glycero-beta-D-manno-heptose 1,7-bisphosphate 7-phosphatase [Halomonas lysinitropha]|uniref:D,D-heptose 1,7-bisphosphate phosphatase n=1 Tax=Halomonas lysinitropha TaxID=2607506 RepID=A0A5K1I255_9GAMM|nr:D-glycero-beta-D-manno-heptose 1,7-bisphosphate 7-phosphatase [Halomonas lysinitropha]VVZ94218.1 D-glycero-beta-D-manno-heptose-1,7-bisphosphate 7-phosphatase [Halomonas lysinitropha]